MVLDLNHQKEIINYKYTVDNPFKINASKSQLMKILLNFLFVFYLLTLSPKSPNKADTNSLIETLKKSLNNK